MSGLWPGFCWRRLNATVQIRRHCCPHLLSLVCEQPRLALPQEPSLDLVERLVRKPLMLAARHAPARAASGLP